MNWVTRNKVTPRVRAFYSINAQDNLGDIEIRNRLLEWIQEGGAELFLYVGKASAEFINAFDINDDAIILKSKKDFIKQVLLSYFSHKIVFIFPPGPRSFGGVKAGLRYVVLSTLSLLLKIRGGRAVLVGGSFRRKGRIGEITQRVFERGLSLCVVRDEQSFLQESSSLIWSPDLALGISEANISSNRSRLTVVLRGDRSLESSLVPKLKKIADSQSLRLTFVTQVGIDDSRHSKLADQYDAEHLAWSGDQRHQLSLVKKMYQESKYVVSDRLHGLILGLNNGAIPVGIVHEGTNKLTSTFDRVCAIPYINPDGSSIQDWDWSAASNVEVEKELSLAFVRIDNLHDSIRKKFLQVLSDRSDS